MTHIVHAESVVVDIVDCLAGETLPIHQEEQRIASHPVHAQRRLLTHRKTELQARHLVGQKVADGRGIALLDLRGGYQGRYHRHIFQCLRCPGGCHHQIVQEQ